MQFASFSWWSHGFLMLQPDVEETLIYSLGCTAPIIASPDFFPWGRWSFHRRKHRTCGSDTLRSSNMACFKIHPVARLKIHTKLFGDVPIETPLGTFVEFPLPRLIQPQALALLMHALRKNSRCQPGPERGQPFCMCWVLLYLHLIDHMTILQVSYSYEYENIAIRFTESQ